MVKLKNIFLFEKEELYACEEASASNDTWIPMAVVAQKVHCNF